MHHKQTPHTLQRKMETKYTVANNVAGLLKKIKTIKALDVKGLKQSYSLTPFVFVDELTIS